MKYAPQHAPAHGAPASSRGCSCFRIFLQHSTTAATFKSLPDDADVGWVLEHVSVEVSRMRTCSRVTGRISVTARRTFSCSPCPISTPLCATTTDPSLSTCTSAIAWFMKRSSNSVPLRTLQNPIARFTNLFVLLNARSRWARSRMSVSRMSCAQHFCGFSSATRKSFWLYAPETLMSPGLFRLTRRTCSGATPVR